jgi:hypothetical protein
LILGVWQHFPILVKIGENLRGILDEDPRAFTIVLFANVIVVTIVTNVPMVAIDLLVTNVTNITMVRMSTIVTWLPVFFG